VNEVWLSALAKQQPKIILETSTSLLSVDALN